METNEIKKPDISGVSEEIQNTIKHDLQAKTDNKGYTSLLSGKRIGISVSDNEELEELGYSSIHLKDLMIEMVRNLLIHGGVIVYGGNIDKEGYTYLFSDLAFQYRNINESKKIYFENYFSFPIHCLLTEEDEAHFKKHRTAVIKVPAFNDPHQDKVKYFPPDTIEDKLVWARSLTAMRRMMISNTDARILVGGKVSNYQGRMPGIIEEAKITLEQKKPLYLIGALGGAAKEVINGIKGEGLRYSNNAYHQSDKYNEFKNQFNRQEGDMIHPEADASFFQDFGIKQLSDVNGLTVEENERLFASSNLPEMLYYIFKGLKKIFA